MSQQTPSQPSQYGPPQKHQNNTVKVLLIVFGIIFLFCICGISLIFILPMMAVVAVPNYLEADVRSKVSRTRADMRVMATGIEAYMVDNNAPPVHIADPTRSLNGGYEFSSDYVEPNFYAYYPGNPGNLSTPIAYLTRHPADPFCVETKPINYYTDGVGWIIWSAGPDREFDVDWTVYNGSDSAEANLAKLVNFTYDPTNGTVSGGDILRVKQ